jgi:GNAT superfamily N-acetyltransferase
MSDERKISIRDMRAEDAPRVFEMVMALARFLGEQDHVTATVETLLEDGFGPTPRYGALVAEDTDGDLVGYTTYSWNYSTFQGNPYLYIDDLYVAENARGLGVARRLVAVVAARSLAIARGPGRVALMVVEWNPAREVYRRLGFETETTSLRQVIEGEALQQLAAIAAGEDACC